MAPPVSSPPSSPPPPPTLPLTKLIALARRPPMTDPPFSSLLSLSSSSLATSALAAPNLNALDILDIFLFNTVSYTHLRAHETP